MLEVIKKIGENGETKPGKAMQLKKKLKKKSVQELLLQKANGTLSIRAVRRIRRLVRSSVKL